MSLLRVGGKKVTPGVVNVMSNVHFINMKFIIIIINIILLLLIKLKVTCVKQMNQPFRGMFESLHNRYLLWNVLVFLENRIKFDVLLIHVKFISSIPTNAFFCIGHLRTTCQFQFFTVCSFRFLQYSFIFSPCLF